MPISHLPHVLEHWRPSEGWSSFVRPAWNKMCAASLEALTTQEWLQLVIMLGDTRANALGVIVIRHAEVGVEKKEQRRWLSAHLHLCLQALGLARGKDSEPVPLTDLGDSDQWTMDRGELEAWLACQLEPFDGDLARAAEFVLRLAAIRTGILEGGPSTPTVEQVLDSTLWTEAAAPAAP
ncbi:MAG: hypothetical protein ACYTFN_21480 [Planctomycetota bacterium]|jgi:hypothetical protein